MKYLHLTVVTLFIALPMFIGAQAPVDDWQFYTNTDNITSIAEDQESLWIGTKGGLVQYNKLTGEQRHFTVLNSGIPSNQVEVVSIDKDGDIWVGTYDFGIARYDGDNWKLFNRDLYPHLVSNIIYDIQFDDDGLMWIGHGSGLSTFDGNDFNSIHFPFYNSIQSIVPLGNGRAMASWIHSSLPPLFMVDNSTVIIDSSLLEENVYRMYTDRQGDIWACHGEGVSQLKNGQWINFDQQTLGLPVGQVYSMTEDQNGLKYFGTAEGIYALDHGAWSIKTTEIKNVKFVYRDNDGNLLAGTEHDNLFRVTSHGPISLDISNSGLINNYVSALYSDNDQLLIGGYNEMPISTFDGLNWGSLEAIPGFQYAYRFITKDLNDHLWVVGHNHNVFEHDGNQWTEHDLSSLNVPSAYCTSLFADSKGRVWLGSYDGAIYYEDGQWHVLNKSNSGLNTNTVVNFAEDAQGNILMATYAYYENNHTYGGGLGVYRNGTVSMFTKSNSNISSNYVYDIHSYEDKVYVIQDHIFTFDGVDFSLVEGEHSTAPDGYFHLSTIGPDGSLWLSSYDGSNSPENIYRFDGEDYHHISMPTTSVSPLTMVTDDDNNLWLGTNSGLMLYSGARINVGVSDRETVKEINVYPNPSPDIFYFRDKDIHEGATLNIYDVNGAQIYRTQTSDASDLLWDATSLPPGIYFYTITSSSGSSRGQLTLLH